MHPTSQLDPIDNGDNAAMEVRGVITADLHEAIAWQVDFCLLPRRLEVGRQNGAPWHVHLCVQPVEIAGLAVQVEFTTRQVLVGRVWQMTTLCKCALEQRTQGPLGRPRGARGVALAVVLPIEGERF